MPRKTRFVPEDARDAGLLLILPDPHAEPVPCPLLNVEAKVRLVAEMAQVELTQTYRNKTGRAMEARYRMPLPVDAAVTGFSATVGDRTVEGFVEEKAKAETTYREALEKGDSAFLLAGADSDAFDVAVGNLAPDETCAIRIRYVQTVPWADGEYRFLLPTVLAPRYVPRGTKADVQPFLGEADYRLRLEATIEGAGEVTKVKSPSHAVKPVFEGGTCRVELREASLLDSDLVLGYRIAAEDRRGVRTTGPGGTYAYARVSVAEDAAPAGAVPREYDFVLDASGSMSGFKIEQATRAVSLCLRSLVKGDRFQVVAFGSQSLPLFPQAQGYDERTLAEAERFLDTLPSLGGTEILEPLRALFAKPAAGGLERVVFLFTDGQVGNESAVVELVRRHARGMRLFAFGIDTAVNRGFIDGLSAAGGGLPEYIYPGEAIEEKVLRQFARVSTPAVEDLRLETVTGGTALPFPTEAVVGFPTRMYAGDSATFALRLPAGDAPEALRLHGVLDGSPFRHDLALVPIEDDGTVARWWARGRIRAMEDRDEYEDDDAIVALSKESGVLSSRTAFVTVLERTDPVTGLRETVRVPSALPSAWEEFGTYIQRSLASPMLAPMMDVSPSYKLEVHEMRSPESYDPDEDPLGPAFHPSSAPRGPAARRHADASADPLRLAVLRMGADGSVGGDPERTAHLALAMMLARDAKSYRGQIRKCLAWLAACGSDRLAVKLALWVGEARGYAKGVATAVSGAADAEARKDAEAGDAGRLAARLGLAATDAATLSEALVALVLF